METKTCSITEDEIKALIASHCMLMLNSNRDLLDYDTHIERINYLNRRLKAEKKEPEPKVQEATPATEQKATTW